MYHWTALIFVAQFLFAANITTATSAQEIGFLEDYALAADREGVLNRLVPGTEEYYYYHSLFYQTNGQIEKVDELLKPWIKRFGETHQVKTIQNRQALLRFDENPKSTYDFLTDRLNLDFNHQRQVPTAERNLPAVLNAELISAEALSKRALRKHGDTDGFTNPGLEHLVGRHLTKTKRRHLLKRLKYPDFPELVELIVNDLKEKDSQGFGGLPIHSNLTIVQLDACLEAMPKLIDNENYANTFLRKLQPSDDVNWRVDREEHVAYLERLYKFTNRLNPAFNSLKACVIFRMLELGRQRGEYDRALFMEYIQLPRQIGYVNPRLVKQTKSRSHIVNLGADYQEQTLLVPIVNDQSLVVDYLHQLLINANNYSAFKPYIRDSFLKREFATVKILNGKGDKEKWVSALSPQQYKDIVNRVDLDFALTNKEFYERDDQVEIELFTKNIQSLIVKIYEINTFNFNRKFKTEIDTDINLDGLVPNFEKTLEYNDDPAIRKLRTYQFDELKGDGVFVVDFIGNGKSSRALIRRGRLSMIGRPTIAGHVFQVIDDSKRQMKDASIWVAGNNYHANESGEILVPFSNQPGQQLAIISAGGISSLQTFHQDSENYSFDAGIYVDRESMLFNQKANVLIRPSLKIAGIPTSVDLLTDVQLIIRSVNQSGIASTKRIYNLKLDDGAETVCEFVVPPRLKSVSFQLICKVENASKNEQQTLSVNRSYDVNSIDSTDEIQDVHLMPTEDGYFLKVRGRTGEIRANQAVRILIYHRDFERAVSVDLQSDGSGKIGLGELQDIVRVEATLVGGSKRSWPVNEPTVARTGRINIVEGELAEIAAPIGMESPTRREISLFEKRRGSIVADHFNSIRFDAGRIFLDGLKAGEYFLRLKSQQQEIAVSVLSGEKSKYAVSGDYRRGELRDSTPLAIESIKVAGDKLRINIQNANELTRVHVFATRYKPGFNSFEEFGRVSDVQPWLQDISVRRSAYMAGRNLSDEYQYILNRRYEKKYPGNMLAQPKLLIQPWSTNDTTNAVESLAEGSDFQNVGTDDDKKLSRGRSQRHSAGTNSDFANLDFLKQPSVIVANSMSNENGAVELPLKRFEGCQHIRVVALDPVSTVQREINLEPADLELRDLRLANALEVGGHFAQMKQIEILGVGDELKIDDLVSGKFHYFDDIGDVFRLFLVLNPGTRLADFEFLLSWNEKSDEEKQRLYSKFACHELNYYLYQKDKPFFENVVAPHIEVKLEQGFVDEFLTRQRLDRFSNHQFEFARLNVFERILLAQKQERRSDDIVRSIDDLYLLNPINREYFDGLYDTSIRTGAMSNGVFSSDFSDDYQDLGLPKLAAENQQYKQPDRSSDGDEIRQRGVAYGGAVVQNDTLGRKPRQLQPATAAANSFAMDRLKEAEPALRSGKDAAKRKSLGYLERLSDEESVEFSKRVDKREFAASEDAPFQDTAGYFELRNKAKSLYRRLPPTKEWIEQQYYHVPLEQQRPELVQANRFWKDYSNHQGGPFLSRYFSESHRSLTEMMFALAVLDLPEKSPEHDFEYLDNSMALTAAGPMIVMHQQFQAVEFEPQNTPILISENFFQKNDRYRHENGIRCDKFVIGQVYAHTLYGAQVVVTNPTSTPQAVDVLFQIPKGSVATSSSQDTKSQPIQLDAFSTKTFEYFFYFPTAGEFTHYPAHVSREEQVLAVADNVDFSVTDDPRKVDKLSWGYVSQNGTDDEVIDFLRQKNVLRLDLKQIAFRMNKKRFFTRVLDTLKSRFAYNHTLWSYGIYHNVSNAATEFLQHEGRIANQVGPYFDSELLEIRPYQKNRYQHREYSPLISARIHKVGSAHKILNPSVYSQYRSLLELLTNRSKLSSEDHLAITYYMLLQNRIAQAIGHFDQIQKDELNEELQYDYCDAYLDFYRNDIASAENKAEKWADYPVDHWRNRFKSLLSQIVEIRGAGVTVVDQRDSQQIQSATAAQTGSFDFEIESGLVEISAQLFSKVEVNYYEMDIELMFSRSPFEKGSLNGFSVIKPTATETVTLENGNRSHTEFELPDQFSNRNVLVEIRAGDQVKAKPYFAHSMALQTVEKYGQLHVTTVNKDQPVTEAYVKVYSRNENGQVKFHKDGYTDLRGRFDYVTQSNNSLDGIQRYSILVLSPEFGAVTRQVDPPAE